jgi:hypothetical protein
MMATLLSTQYTTTAASVIWRNYLFDFLLTGHRLLQLQLLYHNCFYVITLKFDAANTVLQSRKDMVVVRCQKKEDGWMLRDFPQQALQQTPSVDNTVLFVQWQLLILPVSYSSACADRCSSLHQVDQQHTFTVPKHGGHLYVSMLQNLELFDRGDQMFPCHACALRLRSIVVNPRHVSNDNALEYFVTTNGVLLHE